MAKDFSFNKFASKYDTHFGKISGRFYRMLLEQVELFPGAFVLDAGCGTGTVLRRMADICEINGYGIDAEENMIAEARRKNPNMSVQYARCEAMPFEGQFFDIITACMAYHHFADKPGFAKEVARVLKHGGMLYIADIRLPFAIRKLFNGFYKLINVAAQFEGPHEIYERFGKYGFTQDGFVSKGITQVVKMKHTG